MNDHNLQQSPFKPINIALSSDMNLANIKIQKAEMFNDFVVVPLDDRYSAQKRGIFHNKVKLARSLNKTAKQPFQNQSTGMMYMPTLGLISSIDKNSITTHSKEKTQVAQSTLGSFYNIKSPQILSNSSSPFRGSSTCNKSSINLKFQAINQRNKTNTNRSIESVAITDQQEQISSQLKYEDLLNQRCNSSKGNQPFNDYYIKIPQNLNHDSPKKRPKTSNPYSSLEIAKRINKGTISGVFQIQQQEQFALNKKDLEYCKRPKTATVLSSIDTTQGAQAWIRSSQRVSQKENVNMLNVQQRYKSQAKQNSDLDIVIQDQSAINSYQMKMPKRNLLKTLKNFINRTTNAQDTILKTNKKIKNSIYLDPQAIRQMKKEIMESNFNIIHKHQQQPTLINSISKIMKNQRYSINPSQPIAKSNALNIRSSRQEHQVRNLSNVSRMREKMIQFNQEINEMKYQQYRREIKELNMLKKRLQLNKGILDAESKRNLISMILSKEKETKDLEKTFV